MAAGASCLRAAHSGNAHNGIVASGLDMAGFNWGRPMALSPRHRSIAVRACLCLTVATCSPALAAPNGSPTWTRSALAQSVDAARVAASYGVVTSVYRTPAHNRAVGGVPNSYHLAGRAIDVARRPGVSHTQVASMLRKAGYNLVESIDEGDHSHFAFRLPGSGTETADAETAPEQEKPKVRLVAADYHGELLLDVGPKPTLAADGSIAANGSPQKSSR